MKLFKSRKFQVWGIVSAMYLFSFVFMTKDTVSQVFVMAWASYFAFTTSILGLHLGGKAVGMHHERLKKSD